MGWSLLHVTGNLPPPRLFFYGYQGMTKATLHSQPGCIANGTPCDFYAYFDIARTTYVSPEFAPVPFTELVRKGSEEHAKYTRAVQQLRRHGANVAPFRPGMGFACKTEFKKDGYNYATPPEALPPGPLGPLPVLAMRSGTVARNQRLVLLDTSGTGGAVSEVHIHFEDLAALTATTISMHWDNQLAAQPSVDAVPCSTFFAASREFPHNPNPTPDRSSCARCLSREATAQPLASSSAGCGRCLSGNAR